MKRLLLMICGAIFLLSALLTSSALAQTPSMGDLPEDRQHLKRDTQEVSPPVTEGAKENWQLGLSATYMSGKYGTDVRTATRAVFQKTRPRQAQNIPPWSPVRAVRKRQ